VGALQPVLSPRWHTNTVLDQPDWRERRRHLEGAKVFARQDVDPSKLANTTMRGLKRSTRQLGVVLGHRAGLASDRLLAYAEARRQIYLPTYRWVLDHRLQEELAELRLGAAQLVVLLDYETNGDIDDLMHPLSHASLVQRYLEESWPAL
jgi:hypothetical protein